MSRIEINLESFIPTGVNDQGDELGTISVSGRTVKARRIVDGPLKGVVYVHGYVGRYRTSAKAWRATVMMDKRGLLVDFGRDDRSGRFNKQNAISYEPELYDTLCNPLVWLPV